MSRFESRAKVFYYLLLIMPRTGNSSYAVDPAVVGWCLNVPPREFVAVVDDFVEKNPDDLTPAMLVFLKLTFCALALSSKGLPLTKGIMEKDWLVVVCVVDTVLAT